MSSPHETDILKEHVSDSLLAKPNHATFGDSPFDYIRVLRAHKYDLDASVKYMRQTLRVDSIDPAALPRGIYERNPMAVKEFAHLTPMNPFSYSKNGYILSCEFCGLMDAVSFMTDPDASWYGITQDVKHRRYILYNAVREREIKTGTESGLYVIWDLEGAPTGMVYFMRHLLTPTWQNLEFFEHHCVGMVKKLTVINAPTRVATMWSLVKPFVGESVRNVLTVLSGDWRKGLLQDFDADELPVQLGGVKTIDVADEYQYNVEIRPRRTLPIDYDGFAKFRVHHGVCLVGTVPLNTANICNGRITASSAWADTTPPQSTAQLHMQFTCDSGFYFGVYRHEQPDQQIDIYKDELVLPEYRPYPTCATSIDKLSVPLTKPGFYKTCIYNHRRGILSSAMSAHVKVWIEDGEKTVDATYEMIRYDMTSFHY